MNKDKKILITGAGLCGSLLGLRLGQLGYHVDILEKRPDMRKATVDGGRSINLALSDRGLKGLKLVGLEEQVRKLCIPMHARIIHDTEGNTITSKYSGRDGEYINSISREGLNKLLLDEAEKFDGVKIHFNNEVTDVSLQDAEVSVKDSNNEGQKKQCGDVLIGTDGAGSKVRKAMEGQRDFLFSHSIDWLPHGYKELSIPPAEDGGWRIDKHALHIWPRGGFMIIALPNLDGSFTVTIFMRYEATEGEPCFNQITSKEDVRVFFENYFSELIPLIPDLEEQYFENPTPPLGTVRCSPWSALGRTLIMGDASHAIVPFYGQGMNASFEDVVVFDEICQRSTNWEEAFKEFSRKRKPDADAIADLALDNFVEMRDSVAHPNFQKKRTIEMKLESALLPFKPESPRDTYSSKYSLVTFSPHIGYRDAMLRGRAQDRAILWMLEKDQISTEDEVSSLISKIASKTEEVLWLRS